MIDPKEVTQMHELLAVQLLDWLVLIFTQTAHDA